MTLRRTLAAAGVAVLVSGCSGSAPVAGGTPAPVSSRLLAAAALAPCPASVPRPAPGLPDLTLRCLAGGPPVHLAGLRGKPTVVTFWASWCEPCQREVPYLTALAAAAGPRLRLLGVDVEDDPASALDFAAHVGMHYPSVRDDHGTALRRLPALGPPVTAYVDAAGALVHLHRGEYTSAAALRADVARYLGVRV